MKNKSKQKQYKHQLSYFGEEFSKIKTYSLDPWQISYIDRIKKHLLGKNFRGKKLIDIGTGRGYVAVEMAKMGLNVTACDLTPESLDNIARYKEKFKLKNIQLIECIAENIPLKNESIDYLVANAVLEHIPREEEAIMEWKRILKKGGRMMITVPIRYRFVWPFIIPIAYLYDRKIGHLRRYSLGDLRKKFGMRVIKCIYTGHMVKFLGVLVSIIFKTNRFDQMLEKMDMKEEEKRYGSSSIIIFFEK